MRPWNMVIDPAFDHLVIQGSRSGSSELQVSSYNGLSAFAIFAIL